MNQSNEKVTNFAIVRQIQNMLSYSNLSTEEKNYLINYFVSKNYTTEEVFKFNRLDTTKQKEFLSMIGFKEEKKENVETKDKVKTLSLFNNKAAFVSEMYLSFLTGLSLGVFIVCILNLIMLFI